LWFQFRARGGGERLKRPRTGAGWALAIWVCAMAAWLMALIWRVAPTSMVRAIGLLAVAAAMAVVVPYVRWAFRMNVARSSSSRGVAGWLARQPAWCAALIIGGLQLTLGLCTAFFPYLVTPGYEPPGYHPALPLVGWVVMSAGAGAFWALVWQRRRARGPADVARQSHDGPRLGGDLM
jgi:hypothetical protein